jgi:hypothetical protein
MNVAFVKDSTGSVTEIECDFIRTKGDMVELVIDLRSVKSNRTEVRAIFYKPVLVRLKHIPK